MEDEVREFAVGALREMNYDVSGVTGNIQLGPAGLGLESLAIADLVVQAEDRYGVRLTDDDVERLALMTLDEFAAEITKLAAAGVGSGAG
jgi:acyl carrier protein